MKQKLLITLALILISTGCASIGQGKHTFTDDAGAIRGYDPVAYFNDGGPKKGKSSLSVTHGGGVYHFANEANRDAFKADPERYAPQYGGYCAYAMSKGFVVSTDPNAWHIKDDKLYLNYSLGVRKTWLKKRDEYIVKADTNWSKKLKTGLDG